jgi:hypothetical protein
VDVGAPIEAHSKSLELMKPRERSLDDPTVEAEPAAVCGTALRYEGTDSKSSQLLAMSSGVVGAISEYVVRPPSGATDQSSNWRNGVDQRKQLRDVVMVGACEGDGERKSGSVNEKVMLAAGTAAIRGVRPCFFPPRRRLERRKSRSLTSTNRSCPQPEVDRAEPSAPSSTLLLPASRAVCASKSSHIPNRAAAEGPSKGCRSSRRRESRSTRDDSRVAFARDIDTAWASAVGEGVRVRTKAHRRPQQLPCVVPAKVTATWFIGHVQRVLDLFLLRALRNNASDDVWVVVYPISGDSVSAGTFLCADVTYPTVIQQSFMTQADDVFFRRDPTLNWIIRLRFAIV